MKTMRANKLIVVAAVSLVMTSCVPTIVRREPGLNLPATYAQNNDSSNTAKLSWQQYFSDSNLAALIDTVLKNNQELNITRQEIDIAMNEVRARKAEYLPFAGLMAAAGLDKPGRYTSKGSSEATTEIMPGKATPDPLPDFMLGAYAHWELDIWNKLRNAKKSAYGRYLASVNGRHFLVTNLVAEIANSYYELMALDNQLELVKQNIEIQSSVLEMVRLQKEAARVNELAVKRFEAQVFNTKSLQFGIRQKIVETENRINLLVGRIPQPVARSSSGFLNLVPVDAQCGVPSQLLENRPDVKQAEMQLMAAKLDVRSARAQFYPSLGITAVIGLQSFDPAYLAKTPESLLYSLISDLAAPVVNRRAIKAAYNTANARQSQAVYNYERTVLNAYIEVVNQLSNISNLDTSHDLKSREVETLNQAVDISNNLFKSARIDYMEVLFTQRDALSAKFELIEIKKQQMNAVVNIYRALGGGWR